MARAILNLLDKLVAQSGTRLDRIADVVSGYARERFDAETEAEIVCASSASWLDSLKPRRVVHCEYPDNTIQEWRIASEDRELGGGGVTVRLDPVAVDLTDCGIIHDRTSGGGIVDEFSFADQTPSQLITTYVLSKGTTRNGFTHFAIGTIDPTGTLSGDIKKLTPRALLAWLEQQTGAKMAVRRNGSTNYLIDLLYDSTTAAEGRIREGVDLEKLERARDREQLRSALQPTSSDTTMYSGIGLAFWPVTAVVKTIGFVAATSKDTPTASDSTTLSGLTTGVIVVAFLYRSGNDTPPSLPSGWTNIGSSGGDTNSSRICWIRTGSGVTSVTIDNATLAETATQMVMQAYKGCPVTGSPIGASTGSSAASGATIPIPSLTFNVTTGTSWGIGFIGQRTDGDIHDEAHTSFTSRTTGAGDAQRTLGEDTNTGVTGITTSNITSLVTSAHRSWSIELLLGDSYITVKASNDGDGPVAMDDQFVEDTSADPDLPAHYLLRVTGTLEKIKDSWATAATVAGYAIPAQTFAVADGTGFAVDDEIEIDADSSGSFVVELTSPSGYAEFGRVHGFYEVTPQDDATGNRQYATNALLKTWTTKPGGAVGRVNGNQSSSSTLTMDGWPANYAFKNNDVVYFGLVESGAGSYYSGVFEKIVSGDQTASALGVIALLLTSSYTQVWDNQPVLVWPKDSPPDNWSAVSPTAGDVAQYRPDTASTLTGVQADGNQDDSTQGNLFVLAAKLKGLGANALLYMGDYVSISGGSGNKTALVANQVTADGSGLALVPLLTTLRNLTLDETVTITRPDFSGVTTFGNILCATGFSAFRTAAKYVRFHAGQQKLSATMTMIVRAGQAVTVATASAPRIRIHDGSSYVATTQYNGFTLAAGARQIVTITAQYTMTASGTFQVEVNAASGYNVCSFLCWVKLEINDSPTTEPLQGSANGDVIRWQLGNRLLKAHDAWTEVSEYRCLAREITDAEGLEVALSLGQNVRLTAPNMDEDQKLRVREITHDLTDDAKKELALSTALPTAAERIIDAGGATTTISSATRSTTNPTYSATQIDDMLADLKSQIGARVWLGV